MKKFLVLGAVLALLFTGCATVSSIGGTIDAHGLISSANVVSSGAAVIGSYSIILGLFDSGYETYVAAVKQAEASGKTIVSVTTQYFGFLTKITAYASSN
jgi:hypothetical protein